MQIQIKPVPTPFIDVFNHIELELLKSIGFKEAQSGFFELAGVWRDSIYTMVVKGGGTYPAIYLYETKIDFHDNDGVGPYEQTLSKIRWYYEKESLKDFLTRTLSHIEGITIG